MTFDTLDKKFPDSDLLKAVARASEVGSGDRIARLCRDLNSSPEALACFFVYSPVFRNIDVVSLGIFVYQAAAFLF